MAKIAKVPENEWAVIKKHLDDPGVVLIPEHVYDQLKPTQKARLDEILEDGHADYDFGGEPTVYVDLVLDSDAYALNDILETDDEAEGGDDLDV